MIRILVAEDNECIRDNMNNVLVNEGFKVLLAENGLVAYKLAMQNPPDLIISDINMPYLNGYELIQALQNNTRTSRVPFIFLSAETEITKKNCRQYKNAKKYISKPFNLTDLLSAINVIIKMKKLKKIKNVKY